VEGVVVVTDYLTNKLLINSIEAHKRIVIEGETVDLASIGYEEGTPLNRVHQFNAFNILTKLRFPRDEVLNVESKSRAFLDDLAKRNLATKEILESLLKYRDGIK